MPSNSRSYPIARALYPTGALLVAAAGLDFLGRVWPVEFTALRWRFAAETAFLAATPMVMLGLAVLVLAAWADDQPWLLRLVSLVALGYGALLLPLLAVFTLDALDFRELAQEQARGLIRNRALVAGATGLLASVASISLSVGAWRAARGEDVVVARALQQREARRTPPPLIHDVR
jgi:hypothetical protein